MTAGGSTTSLLSFLSVLDYSKYSVDLQLFYKGDLEDLIPSQVRILPYVFSEYSTLLQKRKRNITSWCMFGMGLFYDKFLRRSNVRTQIMGLDTARLCDDIDGNYDIAISFIENTPMYFTMKHVKAQKYIQWIHTDYRDAKLSTLIDNNYLERYNRIVLVSKPNKTNFDEIFPNYSSKSIVIENILSQSFVQKRASEHCLYALPQIEDKTIKLVTVCRIDFRSKGLDRAIEALNRLRKQSLINTGFVWYIIGDGPDYKELESMIKNHSLDDYVFLCGNHNNPLPLSKQCDVFFLPSRFEGKPMAVTEAMMLGLLPIVTEYSSASIQINNGVNGIIVNNSSTGIYEILRQIMLSFGDIIALKENVSKYNYSNTLEYKKIENILDED